jgi:hypothetical protein
MGKESALRIMTPEEKQFAEVLAQIRIGMTRDEVVAILGTPDRRVRLMGVDQFEYGLNPGIAYVRATFESPELFEINKKGGGFRTIPRGAVSTTTETQIGTWDAWANVCFSHDRVKAVTFRGSSPGYFYYEVVK